MASEIALSEQCFVYFIECVGHGLVKIGCARDPGQRIDELRTGCPYKLSLLATTPGGFDLEASFHAEFSSLRFSGEWFRIEGKLREFLFNGGVDLKRTRFPYYWRPRPFVDWSLFEECEWTLGVLEGQLRTLAETLDGLFVPKDEIIEALRSIAGKLKFFRPVHCQSCRGKKGLQCTTCDGNGLIPNGRFVEDVQA